MALVLDVDGPLIDQRLLLSRFAQFLEEHGVNFDYDGWILTGDWEAAVMPSELSSGEWYVKFCSSGRYPLERPTFGAQSSLSALTHLPRHIVTGRPEHHSKPTMDVLCKYFGGFAETYFGFSGRKEVALAELSGVTFFVDDNAREAREVAARHPHVHVILFPVPGRLGFVSPGVTVLQAECSRDAPADVWRAVCESAWREIADIVLAAGTD